MILKNKISTLHLFYIFTIVKQKIRVHGIIQNVVGKTKKYVFKSI